MLKRNLIKNKKCHYSKNTIFKNIYEEKALNFNKTLKYKFCENIKNDKENNSDNPELKRYNYDYEAPENSDFEYKSKLKSFIRLLIRLSIFSLGIYIFFFRKLNFISKKYEIYFLNKTIELKIASHISKKIQAIFDHYIYRHDLENVLFVYEIYKVILEKNNIKGNILSPENIFVLESESLGCFMLKNGDFFISSRLVEVCKGNPNHLAFFISCEIAYQAIGKDSARIFKIIMDLKTQNTVLIKRKKNLDEDLPRYSIIEKKFKDLEFYNRYLLFYPDSIIMTYLEEKDLLKIALKILHKANFNIYDAIEIMKFFDEKMQFYPCKYQEINRSVRYRYYDILQNLVKIYMINQIE